MTRKFKTRIVGLLIIILAAGGFGLWNWWQWAIKPYSVSQQQEPMIVTPGMTAAKIANELEQRHLVRSARAFQILARLKNVDSKLYAGDYLFSASMTPEEMIDRLLKGPASVAIRITIPEGYTTEQVIDVLVKNGLGSKEEYSKVVSSDKFDYPFLKGIPNGKHRLEGFLFPDTYFIDKKSSPHEIVNRLLNRFSLELTPEAKSRLQSMNLSVTDWVTLSSLVEKEAAHETDRPLIASVMMNRLKIDMALQVDATIQFILGEPKPKLYNKDLKIPSPYNTYLHKGLPPGPISNPGHASLEAVLHPAKTDYFYYVAKSDGYHAFAKTFKEHLHNIELYQ